MDSGFYAACAGLRAQTQALEVVANNLANLSTSGYRGQQPTFRSLLAGAQNQWSNPLNFAINDFNVLGGSRVDLTAGNLEHTGNGLDLAIEGNGFFAVQTKAGTLYTRNGGFQTSTQGQLATAQGDLVMGEQGPLTLPAGTVSISPDGTVSVNGAVAGKVRMVEFPADAELTPAGGSFYSAPDGAARPASGASLRQGMIESSNVSAVAATVALLSVQRHAEMLGRALSVFHTEFNHIAASELPRL